MRFREYLLEGTKVKNSNTWDTNFFPGYTPMEMLDKGVFMDCYYNYRIPNMPKSWYSHKNVIKPGEDTDVSRNHYGVDSRLSLKKWKENGWLTEHSPLGWWEWYAQYYYGRRIPKEDVYQIGRWRSFVARHMGQIRANCKLDDELCRPRQRQGLLHWAWDSSLKYDIDTKIRNLKRFGIDTTDINEV